MAEIVAAGYTHLRTVGPVTNWFVALRESGTEIARMDSTDSRCAVSDDTTNQTVTFEIEIHGDDADLGTLPTTIDEMVAYDSGSGGTQLSAVEAFTGFTYDSTDDVGIFRFKIQVPEQV